MSRVRRHGRVHRSGPSDRLTAGALPDFFVIGAPKSGTTALHAALAQHPDLFLSAVNEPKFFLCDGPPAHRGGPGDAHSSREWIWQRDQYEHLFDAAPPGTLRDESTSFYLADAHRRIHDAVPGARLIAILRDPVDRAYSNWAHLWADGLEPVDNFVAACAEEPHRTANGWAPIWRYLETGLYGRQLRHLFTVFPRDQVHLIRYKSLVDEPGETLDAVCRFLGVREGMITEAPARNVGGYVAPSPYTRLLQAGFRFGASVGSHFHPVVWRKASLPLQWLVQRSPRHRPELAERDRAMLVDYFAEDTDMVEEETGWDLSQWRTYREGGTYSVRKSWAPSRRLVS
ncbi:MAG: sulfotransferase family protein [Acidimicrobiales bacterium]